MWRSCLLLCGLSTLCLSGMVRPARAAQPPTPISIDDLMARGRMAETNLEYEEAAEIYLEIVARTDLTEEQRIEANLCAGRVTRIMGKDAEARMYFNYVLLKQPDYRMPSDAPPKVANFFELVRQEMVASRGTIGTSIAPQPLPASGSRQVDDNGSGVTSSSAQRAPFPVWLGLGGGVIGIGAIIAGVSAACGLLSADAQQRALATSVQTSRIAHYDERDQYSLVANIGYATAAVLLAGGAATVAAGLFMGGE